MNSLHNKSEENAVTDINRTYVSNSDEHMHLRYVTAVYTLTVQESYYWEADSRSVDQNILRLLQNPKVYECV